ncbi:STAS domain-containing protein [Actinomycetospora sp. CA-101289]|uniref:STAS domain-containing protein n=1 Tax=Actinomycetospora sp. CA-101289 TaxID=3239893 RepID=UPI003D969233
MTAFDVQHEHDAPPVVQVEATIRLAGRADEVAITEITATIRRLVALGVRHVVVDVSEAGVLPGALLSVLARTHVRLSAEEPAGSLRLAGVHQPHVAAALETAGLDEVFLVYDAVRRSGSRTAPHVAIPAPRSPGERRTGRHSRDSRP